MNSMIYKYLIDPLSNTYNEEVLLFSYIFELDYSTFLLNNINNQDKKSRYNDNKSISNKYNAKLDEHLLKKFEFLRKKIVFDSVPVQYITKGAYFFKDKFYVNNNTLIPRSETEFIPEFILNWIDTHTKIKPTLYMDNIDVLDIFTGSGAIGLSIAKYYKSRIKPNIYLSDISESALTVADINRKTLVPNTPDIRLIKSDLFKNKRIKYIKFDVISANPPYIPRRSMRKLNARVKNEPRIALFRKGSNIIRIFLKQVVSHIKENNSICITETNDNDFKLYKYINKRTKKNHPSFKVSYIKDIYGIHRYILIET